MDMEHENRYDVARETLGYAMTATTLLTAPIIYAALTYTAVEIIITLSIALIGWSILTFAVTPHIIAYWIGMPVDELLGQTHNKHPS